MAKLASTLSLPKAPVITPTQHAAIPDWTPIVTLDISTASSTAFDEAFANFKAHIAAHPSPPVPLESLIRMAGPGRCEMTVTPQVAELCLLNNAGNRKVSLAHVNRIASLMRDGRWRIAEPWLFNDQGKLENAQHRAWAVYLSGVTIDTSVVVVPTQRNLFAIIDAGKARSAADAIFTAGGNGQSSSIAAAVNILHRYENNQLRIIKAPKGVRKLSNEEVLEYASEHPRLQEAAHLVAGSYIKAANVVGKPSTRGVTVAFAYLVCETHGASVLDDFFGPLGTGANLEELSPILGLRNRLTNAGGDDEDDRGLSQPHRFGLLIQAFNLWRAGQFIHKKKGLFIADNEKFPTLVEDTDAAQAAE